MKRVPLLMLILGSASLGAHSAVLEKRPALTGTLAYIRKGEIRLTSAAGGPERRLRGSKGAEVASLSPAKSGILFFTPLKKQKSDSQFDWVYQAFASRAPFVTSLQLPAPAKQIVGPTVTWSPDGGLGYAVSREAQPGGDKFFAYRSTDGRLSIPAFPVQTASRNGEVTAWANEERIEMQRAGSKAVTTLFSRNQVGLLRAALRRVRPSGRFQQFERAMREPGAGQFWISSPPAVTPDGKKIYFACNGSSLVGASGGTTWCFFQIDLASRKLSVLPGPGVFEGMRIPDVCRVSPDGRKLLFVTVGHSSAIENSRWVYVVDLDTQRVREFLHHGPYGDEINLTAGPPCWSPDSRYVVLDVLYYRLIEGRNGGKVQSWKPEGGWAPALEYAERELDGDEYAVRIFDVATGRLVRSIPHAYYPSWSL